MEAYIDTGILVLAVVGGFSIVATLFVYFLKFLDDQQEKKNRKAREERQAYGDRERFIKHMDRTNERLEYLERELGSLQAQLFVNNKREE